MSDKSKKAGNMNKVPHSHTLDSIASLPKTEVNGVNGCKLTFYTKTKRMMKQRKIFFSLQAMKSNLSVQESLLWQKVLLKVAALIYFLRGR